MKKISMLLVAGIGMVAALQLTSCKKDSNSSTTTLVGTWGGQTANSKISMGCIVLLDTTMSISSMTLTIKADNSYNMVDAADSTNNDNGTYATSGTKLYMSSADGSKDTMDYTLTSSQLTLKSSTVDASSGTTITSDNTIIFTKK